MLSFINGFIDYFSLGRTFFWAICLVSDVAFFIVEQVFFKNFSLKRIMLFLLMFFYICSIDEARKVFVYLDLSTFNRFVYLFLSGIILFSSDELNKRNFVFLSLFIVSIVSLFVNNIFIAISFFLVLLICLFFYKKLNKFLYLDLVFCFFNILTYQFNLFGINFVFLISYFILKYQKLYFEYKDMNYKELEIIALNQKILKLKEETLKTQIKPHFLFNSLSMVDALYLNNHQKGEQTILKLKSLMEKTNEYVKKDSILFLEELSIVDEFVSLMNEKESKKFVLKKELEVVDFSLPPLSIEPIIENSIKYSGVNKKEDGYIKIHSFEKDGFINIVIEDNGIGFDINVVKDNSFGLKNLIERFSLLDGGSVNLSSNNGTKVEIKFKK